MGAWNCLETTEEHQLSVFRCEDGEDRRKQPAASGNSRFCNANLLRRTHPIPQECHKEPFVRHAIFALTALCAATRNGMIRHPTNISTSRWCNTAR